MSTETVTKRVSEIVPLTADFGDRLQPDEDLATIHVVCYEYDADCHIEDFDLADAEHVIIEAEAGGVTLERKSFLASGYTTARLALLTGNFEVASMLTDGSLDESGHAANLDESRACVQFQGGLAGLTYRVAFTATCNSGSVYMQDFLIVVVSD